MGYDRNDPRYGREQSYGDRTQGTGRDYDRGYERTARSGYGGERHYGSGDQGRGRGDYGRTPQGYDYDDRGFFDRAGDEVRSWFGDEEAERRRRYDERNAQREYERDQARGGRESYGRDSRSSWLGDGGIAGALGGYGWNDRAGGRDADRGNDRSRDHDPSYRSWRDRQIEALDRDYEDYRREHQSKFDSEFAGWRGKRQTQRDSLKQVQEHQEVVGSDGQHVGKVDHVRGDRILLAKNDENAGGHHHSIPSSWIVEVGSQVKIDRTADQARAAWRDEENDSAIGGSKSGSSWSDDRSSAPRNLNRSFSGTY